MKHKSSLPLLLLIIIPQILFAKLTVYFDCNRFLSQEKNTIFEITYKILHKDLGFTKLDRNLNAQINVDFIIYNANDKQLYQKDFTRRITAKNKEETDREDFFYIDKIIAQVQPGTYRFSVEILDQVGKEKVLWDKIFSTLPAQGYSFSDIEIDTFSKEDTGKSLQNFRRDHRIFLVCPNKIFYPQKTNELAYYFEFYPANNDTTLTEINISIFDEDSVQVYNHSESYIPTSWKGSFWDAVSISDWKAGKYKFVVSAFNQQIPESHQIITMEYIFLKKVKSDFSRKKLDREYEIAKYFLSNNDQQLYKRLSDRGKFEFLIKFWIQNDPNPKTDKNEVKEIIIQRIDYAKEHYSSLGQKWETDRGRIYVRNGKPDEVINKGFEYRAKPYLVWKYYQQGFKKVYLFVDFTGMSVYRLVYCENDDNEVIDPGWRDYLGPYFDDGILE